MHRYIVLLAALAFLVSSPFTHSQDKGVSSNPALSPNRAKPPKKARVGVYAPGDPRADLDGFIWEENNGGKSSPIASEKPSGLKNRKAPVAGNGAAVADQKTTLGNSRETKGINAGQGAQAASLQTGNPSTHGREGAKRSAQRAPAAGYLSEYYRDGQAKSGVSAAREGSIGSTFFKMIGGLAIVAGLVILGAAILRRIAPRGVLGVRGRTWKVIETIPLGPKRTLYVTQFVDRVILLGATDQGISLLSEIHDATLAQAVESGGTDFRRFLVPETLGGWEQFAGDRETEKRPGSGAETEGSDAKAPGKETTGSLPLRRSITV